MIRHFPPIQPLLHVGLHTYLRRKISSGKKKEKKVSLRRPVVIQLFLLLPFSFFLSLLSPCRTCQAAIRWENSHHATVRLAGPRAHGTTANDRAGQSQQSRSLRHAQSKCVRFRSEDRVVKLMVELAVTFRIRYSQFTELGNFTISMTIPVNSWNYCFTRGFYEFSTNSG